MPHLKMEMLWPTLKDRRGSDHWDDRLFEGLLLSGSHVDPPHVRSPAREMKRQVSNTWINQPT